MKNCNIDPFRDCRLKPIADSRVLTEICVFVQDYDFSIQQPMFDVLVENRGEA